MCVTHPNPSNSVPSKPVKNARLFSPLGVSRGAVLLLLLACFVFTPLSVKAFEGFSNSQNSFREKQNNQRLQKEAEEQKRRILTYSSRQTSSNTADAPLSKEREAALKKYYLFITASQQARRKEVQQMNTAVKDFSDWANILNNLDDDEAKFEENVVILFEKYTEAMEALGRAGSGIPIELSLHGKIANAYGRTGQALARSNAAIKKLRSEQSKYDITRKECEMLLNATLARLVE